MLIIDSDSRGKDVRKSYPSLILGFVKFQGDDKVMAVIRTAESDLPWENIKKEFVSSFEIGIEFNVRYDLVPVTTFVHPRFVFQDYGGEPTKFFCALPKKNWAEYFSDKIVMKDDQGGADSERDDEGR